MFKAQPFDFDTMTTAHKLTVFNLFACYALDSIAPPTRPAGVLSGDTLIDIGSFLDKYFVNLEGGMVAKGTVLALAKAFYTELEVPDEVIVSKITRLDIPLRVLYDKPRTMNGVRGCFVNLAEK